jgi:hypothetical protein
MSIRFLRMPRTLFRTRTPFILLHSGPHRSSGFAEDYEWNFTVASPLRDGVHCSAGVNVESIQSKSVMPGDRHEKVSPGRKSKHRSGNAMRPFRRFNSFSMDLILFKTIFFVHWALHSEEGTSWLAHRDLLVLWIESCRNASFPVRPCVRNLKC